jgi:3-oxoacyl-[acyl-carrier-protein] synthase III
MQLRGSKIFGVGSYLPDKVLSNADLEKIVDTTDEWIVNHTGIRERRMADASQACSDLCIPAASSALLDAGITPDQIGMVIVTTVTADMTFPATACLVQDAIGAKHAGAFDLVSGCTGFIYGLGVSHGLIASGSCEYALVISGEVLTRVTDWTDRSTCVLFGDGAGAAVVGPAEPGAGVLSFVLRSMGEFGDLLKISAGGSRLPMTPELLAQHEDCIRMQGHDVFKLAVRGVPEVAQAAMDKAGVGAHDIACAVMHQANRRILDAAAKRLDIPEDRVVVNVDRYGNTSAASIPIALDEVYRAGRLAPGDLVLLLGFGAGFTLGAAVVQWDKPRFQA